MNIAYGVHGYGRGHASRALPVIRELRKHHVVRAYAGGAAYDFLKDEVDTVRIPYLAFHQWRKGKNSTLLTLLKNLPHLADLTIGGSGYDKVCEDFWSLDPDVLITDSEPWTCLAARDYGIPIISFDHYGVIARCRPDIRESDRFRVELDRIVYRAMVPSPDKVLISSFYKPERSYATVVTSILREEVKEFTPSRGEHVLAYFSIPKPRKEIEALRILGTEVRLYGTDTRGREGNLVFKAPSNREFLKDLSTCNFVVASAGNQLTGEAIYYNKPLLVVPENAVEQRLNATYIEKLGIGMEAPALTADALIRFRRRVSSFYGPVEALNADGLQGAMSVLRGWLEEL